MSLEEEIEKCSKIHDNVAEFWNSVYFDTPYHEPSSWIVREYVKQLKPDVERRVPVVFREIEELLGQHPDDSFSILDVGCGVGGFVHRILSLLPEKYPNIRLRATGIDISNEMIEHASKNLHNFNVELICDSITNSDLKFKNEPFDVAIMMVTLSFYNNENVKEILRAIHNKLKKGGCLLLMDFAWTYKWAGLKLFAKPLQKLTDMLFSQILGEPFHFTNRIKDQLEAILNDVGFEVSKSYLTEEKSKMKGMLIIAAKKETKKQELTMELAVSASK